MGAVVVTDLVLRVAAWLLWWALLGACCAQAGLEGAGLYLFGTALGAYLATNRPQQ